MDKLHIIVVLSILFVNIEAAPKDLSELIFGSPLGEIYQQTAPSYNEGNVRTKRQDYYDYDYGGVSSFQYNFPNGFDSSQFFNSLFSQFQRQFNQIANFIRVPGGPSRNTIPVFIPTFYLPTNCDCYSGNGQVPADNGPTVQGIPPNFPNNRGPDGTGQGKPSSFPSNQGPDGTGQGMPSNYPNNNGPDGTVQGGRIDMNGQPVTTTTIKSTSVNEVITTTTTEATATGTDFQDNRVGDIDDNDDDDEDFDSRPISFDPIRLDRPNLRPPPPVEHGSTQGRSPDP